MSKKTRQVALVGIAAAWTMLETGYFGWHFFPHSLPELAADGLGVAIASLALLI